ncbi:MAG: helix-turn-helix domain-containing protein [Chloroflexota bacterium]|nr:helix-turn-helix domain-containing protein [Chloroflexota bacterium]PLS79072.1 MAG: XRE family transcriptional regulator [Chloroflexota bacterium]
MPTLNERIGEIVKQKRQRDRMTQADLGARIGVSGSYIGSIESAQTSPRIGELEGLAKVFRTTAFELITEAAQPDPRTFTTANRDRNAFLGLYDALSPESQKQVRQFMLFLRHQQDHPNESES